MTRISRRLFALGLSAIWAAAGAAKAGEGNEGPDLIMGSLPNLTHWTSGGAVDGLRAYSASTTACNVGTERIDWFQGPNPAHPVRTATLYRLRENRIEQIGLSWVAHAFCAIQQNLCQTCEPVGGCCCSELGIGCSTSNVTNGSFSNLGPRSEINIHQGSNLGTHAFPEGSEVLRGRLQVRQDDLDPALNPGAQYFVEGHYIGADDATYGAMTNDNNNVSYRRVIVNAASYFMSVSGPTIREEAAIYAWRENDPGVTIVKVDVPDEGRFTLAYRVTELGSGLWHYEYALFNLSSHRSARAFSVPVPAGIAISEVGFHDVDYHSGEPYSLEDWVTSLNHSRLTWSTETFAENENANALRWGTLYNFRFDAAASPTPVNGIISLFRPGSPQNVSVALLGPLHVAGDVDGDGDVDLGDYAGFVACVGGPGVPPTGPDCGAADLDADGDVDLVDKGLFQLAFTGTAEQ